MSTRYEVVLALRTEGELGAKLAALTGHADNADRHITHLGESFSRFGEMAGGALERTVDRVAELGSHFAKLGGAAILAGATYGVAHLNRQLEETQISLGAIGQAQGFAKTFEEGFTLAGDQVRKMKQDVKTLPGDLGQLSSMMTMLATPVAQGGASMDQIRQLAGRTMLTSAILGVPQEVASREMANLLAGRAGAHNILGSRLGFIGDTAQKFNKETAADRLADIGKALDKYQGAADRFGNSFTAQWTTLKDNIKYTLIAPSTGGLFDHVKFSLGEINKYFDDHKTKIEEIASTVDRRLVAGWDEIERIVKRVGPILGEYADKFIHMQPVELGKKLEHAGEFVLGAKVGGAALSAGSSALPMALRLMGGAGGVGELGAGMTALGEAMPLIGAAALPAALALAGAAGAVDILTDKTSIYHTSAVQMSKDIGEGLVSAAEKLSAVTGPARDRIHQLGDMMGSDLLIDAKVGTDALNGFLDGIISFGHQLHSSLPPPGISQEDQDKLDKFNTQPPEVPEAIKDRDFDGVARHLMALSPHEAFGAQAAMAPNRAPAGHGGTNIQNVQIVIPGNTDPSRVARLTVATIKRLGQNPTRSRFVPNFESP